MLNKMASKRIGVYLIKSEGPTYLISPLCLDHTLGYGLSIVLTRISVQFLKPIAGNYNMCRGGSRGGGTRHHRGHVADPSGPAHQGSPHHPPSGFPSTSDGAWAGPKAWSRPVHQWPKPGRWKSRPKPSPSGGGARRGRALKGRGHPGRSPQGDRRQCWGLPSLS